MKYSIKLLNDNDPLWQEIHSLKNYSIYHTKEWKNLIEKTFNHKALYWSAVVDDKLSDVLPFFQIKKIGLGKKLISTPYESCNGSFLSQESSIHRRLIENIIEYCKKSKIKYVEIRSKQPVEILKELKFEEMNPFFHTELKLIGTDENWKCLSAKHRRNVRYALNRQNVKIRSASTISEMEVFYKILAQHYKRMGIPFFNKKFFCQIWQKLIEKHLADLLITEFEDDIIGGHLLLLSGETLISKYSAHKLHGKYKKIYASYASNWCAIKYGIKNNLKYYSLGITGSSNIGLLKFKSSFGGKNNQIHFYYRPINGKIPDLAKYYDEYSIIKKAWSVLPELITRPLGQKINEWIS